MISLRYFQIAKWNLILRNHCLFEFLCIGSWIHLGFTVETIRGNDRSHLTFSQGNTKDRSMANTIFHSTTSQENRLRELKNAINYSHKLQNYSTSSESQENNRSLSVSLQNSFCLPPEVFLSPSSFVVSFSLSFSLCLSVFVSLCPLPRTVYLETPSAPPPPPPPHSVTHLGQAL